jgi:predicted Zn-ribbon and HTH transcriptional regulator
MQHDAARSKRISFEEMPVDQPMRPAARREISRNPSTDQKKQRRQQMRKSAGDMAIGHVQCQSCGYEGHPVLGDTGKACRNCNSYSVSPQKRAVPGPDNSRYLEKSDYGRTAKVDFDQCGYCGVENALVKDGLCPRHEHMRNDGREDDDSWQSQDDQDRKSVV